MHPASIPLNPASVCGQLVFAVAQKEYGVSIIGFGSCFQDMVFNEEICDVTVSLFK
jgi:hypothetical protein